MKNHILHLAFSLISICALQAQPDTLWSQTYGGQNADGGRAVIEAIDGGYIIAGYTYSSGAGYADFYLVKTDIDGEQEWAKTYGGENMDYAYDVCRSTELDGYIIVGYTASFGNGSKDVYMIKTDLSGNELWTHTFGGEGMEIAKSVIPTSDGHYLVCGYTQAAGTEEDDIYLIKTDQQGVVVWEKTIGSEHSEMGEDIIETSDGNYLLAGSSGLYDIPGNNSGNNREMYLAKIDPSGNILAEGFYWIMQSNQGAYDDGYAVCENIDGQYFIVGGCTRESVEVMDIGVVKTDSQLNIIWKKHFEMDESSFYDFTRAAISPAPDGGVVVCGSFKYASSLTNDLFVMEIDSSGNEEYAQFYGGDGSEAAYAAYQTTDDNIVITGHTTSIGNGSYDVWLLKFDLQTGLLNNMEPENTRLHIFPNPGDERINIRFYTDSRRKVKVSIVDLSGKVVKILNSICLDAGEHHMIWDGRNSHGVKVPAGIYFCTLVSGNVHISRKIVKI